MTVATWRMPPASAPTLFVASATTVINLPVIILMGGSLKRGVDFAFRQS